MLKLVAIVAALAVSASAFADRPGDSRVETLQCPTELCKFEDRPGDS